MGREERRGSSAEHREAAWLNTLYWGGPHGGVPTEVEVGGSLRPGWVPWSVPTVGVSQLPGVPLVHILGGEESPKSPKSPKSQGYPHSWRGGALMEVSPVHVSPPHSPQGASWPSTPGVTGSIPQCGLCPPPPPQHPKIGVQPPPPKKKT